MNKFITLLAILISINLWSQKPTSSSKALQAKPVATSIKTVTAVFRESGTWGGEWSGLIFSIEDKSEIRFLNKDNAGKLLTEFWDIKPPIIDTNDPSAELHTMNSSIGKKYKIHYTIKKVKYQGYDVDGASVSNENVISKFEFIKDTMVGKVLFYGEFQSKSYWNDGANFFYFKITDLDGNVKLHSKYIIKLQYKTENEGVNIELDNHVVNLSDSVVSSVKRNNRYHRAMVICKADSISSGNRKEIQYTIEKIIWQQQSKYPKASCHGYVNGVLKGIVENGTIYLLNDYCDKETYESSMKRIQNIDEVCYKGSSCVKVKIDGSGCVSLYQLPNIMDAKSKYKIEADIIYTTIGLTCDKNVQKESMSFKGNKTQAALLAFLYRLGMGH